MATRSLTTTEIISAPEKAPVAQTRYEYNALDMLVRCEINGEAMDGKLRRLRSANPQNLARPNDHVLLGRIPLGRGECDTMVHVRVYVYEDNVALVPFMFVEYLSLMRLRHGKRYYIFTDQIGVRYGWRTMRDKRVGALGSTRMVTRISGQRLEIPLRFPGHYYDPETGLHYNRFRYYSPESGATSSRIRRALREGSIFTVIEPTPSPTSTLMD